MKHRRLKELRIRKNSPCFAFLVNLAAMAAMLLLMHPFYETNDDLAFAQLASGFRGVKEAHLVFQNYGLGALYRFLYELTGRLPWYMLVQYGVLLLSFSAVTWVLINRLEGFSGLYLSVILLCCFGYQCYIHPQFTKAAGVAAASAVFLLFYVLSQKRISARGVLFGLALGLLGFMYREDQFFASGALMAGVGVFFLLTLKRRFAGEARRRLICCVCVFGALLAAAGVLNRADALMYRSPQWQEYLEYNNLRSRLLDYGFPPYEENRELYEELKIDESAYELYKSWNFNDPEKFSADVMARLAEQKQKQELTPGFVLHFLKRFPSDVAGLTPAYFCGGFLLLWLIFGKKSRAAAFALLFEAVLLTDVYFYLYYSGRYLIPRVDAGLWFSVCLTVLWLLTEEGGRPWGKRAGLAVCVGAVALSQILWLPDWKLTERDLIAYRGNHRAILETIGADQEHVYLAKSGVIPEVFCYGPLDRLPENQLTNLFWFGGWECGMPKMQEAMEAQGIVNPYRDMIGNERVYLIDDDIELTMNYVRKYYDPGAEAVFVKTLGDVNLYQIRAS